jgi:hypothetical protein
MSRAFYQPLLIAALLALGLVAVRFGGERPASWSGTARREPTNAGPSFFRTNWA